MFSVAKHFINSTQIQHKYLIWSNKHNWSSIFNPLLCGFAMAIFSYMLVYLDSSEPGINPPSPFSSKSNKRFRRMKSSVQLGYITALLSGVVVSILMCTNF